MRSVFWVCLWIIFGASGCAIEDGDPWGVLSVNLDAAFAPSADRLEEGGAFKSARSYSIEVERLVLELGAVSVRFQADAASSGVEVFDPAAPPAGYSLCHGGHCHHDSGALVAYEDIAAELASGSGTGASTAAVLPVLSPTTLEGAPVAVPLEACLDACQLDRGSLERFEVATVSLTIEARVRDLAVENRLPGGVESIAISAVVPLEGVIRAALSAEVGKGAPLHIHLSGRLSVAASLFDDVDWGELTATRSLDGGRYVLSDQATFVEQVRARFHNDAVLEVSIMRGD